VKLDYQTIQALFGMPQPNAARMLGIALTTLKQVCRRFGIARWPYTRTFYDTGRARQSSPVDGSACSYFARSVEPQSDASDVAMVDESDSQGAIMSRGWYSDTDVPRLPEGQDAHLRSANAHLFAPVTGEQPAATNQAIIESEYARGRVASDDRACGFGAKSKSSSTEDYLDRIIDASSPEMLDREHSGLSEEPNATELFQANVWESNAHALANSSYPSIDDVPRVNGWAIPRAVWLSPSGVDLDKMQELPW
jgi:hypothetical protein